MSEMYTVKATIRGGGSWTNFEFGVPIKKRVISLENMKRAMWVARKWIRFSKENDFFGDGEWPYYVDMGVRPIEEVESAGRQFDEWSKNIRAYRDMKGLEDE